MIKPYQSQRSRRIWTTAIACAFWLSPIFHAVQGFQPAWADVALKKLSDPLPTYLQTRLHNPDLQVGSPFETELHESVSLNGHQLPKGTVFRGRVTHTESSQRLARPGYFQLNVDEVVLPSGDQLSFKETDYKQDKKHIHHPKGITMGDTAKGAVPYAVVGSADSIALEASTSLPSGGILAISLGARMALGVVLEFTKYRHEHDDWNVAKRLGYGMLRGTGVTAAYKAMKVAPEPSFDREDLLDLHMTKKKQKALFDFAPTVPNASN